MGNSFDGPRLHVMDYSTLDVVRNQGEARAPLPTLKHLRTVSMCRNCHEGLARAHRCTRNASQLAFASLEQLVDGVGSGAGCCIDRDEEIDQRTRRANSTPQPKRRGILERLHLRRTP